MWMVCAPAVWSAAVMPRRFLCCCIRSVLLRRVRIVRRHLDLLGLFSGFSQALNLQGVDLLQAHVGDSRVGQVEALESPEVAQVGQRGVGDPVVLREVQGHQGGDLADVMDHPEIGDPAAADLQRL